MVCRQSTLFTLQNQIRNIPDPRQSHKIRYPLPEILFLMVSSVVSGHLDYEEMLDFGEDHLDWLRQYYPYENGLPSHDTLNRVLGLLDASVFMSLLSDWAKEDLRLEVGTLISLDGKRLRSSATKKEQQTPKAAGGRAAVHVVEAWCNDLSLTLATRQVEDKENEIVAIPMIIKELEIENCVVSIDAIGCQKDIASDIRRRRANYLLGLKGNHPGFLEEVSAAFEEHGAACGGTRFDEDYDMGHGRVEHRVTRVLPAEVLSCERLKGWEGIKSLISVESERFSLSNDKAEHQTRYYISSLEADAKTLQGYIRGHWGIENRLHYMLDVYWGEDESRKRNANTAANFSVILRWAHNMTQKHPDKISLKRKQGKADRSNHYREQILGLNNANDRPHKFKN